MLLLISELVEVGDSTTGFQSMTVLSVLEAVVFCFCCCLDLNSDSDMDSSSLLSMSSFLLVSSFCFGSTSLMVVLDVDADFLMGDLIVLFFKLSLRVVLLALELSSFSSTSYWKKSFFLFLLKMKSLILVEKYSLIMFF